MQEFPDLNAHILRDIVRIQSILVEIVLLNMDPDKVRKPDQQVLKFLFLQVFRTHHQLR